MFWVPFDCGKAALDSHKATLMSGCSDIYLLRCVCFLRQEMNKDKYHLWNHLLHSISPTSAATSGRTKGGEPHKGHHELSKWMECV